MRSFPDQGLKACDVTARANGPGNMWKEFVQACKAATKRPERSISNVRHALFVLALQASMIFG